MDSHPKKDKQVRRVILIEGSINCVVLIAKVIVGMTTGSLAIIGDAIHSLTDVVNNIIAWVIIRISAAPPDKGHPYGHRKFETLAVFFLASLLIVLGFELAMQAIKKENTDIIATDWGLAIMLAVLVINIVLSTWERRWAKRLESDILLADASHTFADVLTTIVIIVGWQLSAMGYFWLDRLCALGVSLLIFRLAYSLFKRAFPVLLDGYSVDPERLSRAIASVEGVLQVERVRSRWIGAAKSVDLILCVDPDLSTEQAHAIADKVESLLHDRFEVKDISIHIEPYHEND